MATVSPHPSPRRMADESILVTQRKSGNGASPRQRDTLRSLGLGRIGRSVEHRDTPVIRGMVKTVQHLVTLSDQGTAKRTSKADGPGTPSAGQGSEKGH